MHVELNECYGLPAAGFWLFFSPSEPGACSAKEPQAAHSNGDCQAEEDVRFCTSSGIFFQSFCPTDEHVEGDGK